MKRLVKRKSYGIIRGTTVGIAFALQIATIVFLSFSLMKGAAGIYLALELISVFTVFSMVNEEEPYKNGWIIIILVLPVAGLFLYFMWGRKRRNSKENKKFRGIELEMNHLLEQEEPIMEQLHEIHPNKLHISRYLQKSGYPIYQNTKVDYFPTGEEMIQKMMEDIKQAKHFIFLEYFIVSDGRVWKELLEALTQKVQEGVEVKLLFDDFGTLILNSKEFREDLKKRGITLGIYNPIHKGVARLSFNYRNHQKITVIDGNIGYTGGINLADEYANYIERFGYWKDTGIRLEGEGVWSLTYIFMMMWKVVNPEDFKEKDPYRPTEKLICDGYVQPFAGGPYKNPNNPIEGAYTRMINKARDYLYITTPYLVLDQSMRADLVNAARSGVDVRIIVPAIYDKWVVYNVNVSNYGKLMEAGIRIFEYTPGFIHAKNMIADDECGICGTINADYRSLYHHYECAAFLCDIHAVGDMKKDFLETQKVSKEMNLEEWKKRPFIQKLVQSMLKLLSPML